VYYYLTKYPEIQRKAQEEIDSVFNSQGFSLESIYDHKDKCHFKKPLIYESLRHTPVAFVVARYERYLYRWLFCSFKSKPFFFLILFFNLLD